MKRRAALSEERAAGAERQLKVLQTIARDEQRVGVNHLMLHMLRLFMSNMHLQPHTGATEAKMQHLLQQNERLNAQILTLRNE